MLALDRLVVASRFLASRSRTAAAVCLVMSGMSQLFRQASVFDLAASVLSTFIANVSAFVGVLVVGPHWPM